LGTNIPQPAMMFPPQKRNYLSQETLVCWKGFTDMVHGDFKWRRGRSIQ